MHQPRTSLVAGLVQKRMHALFDRPPASPQLSIHPSILMLLKSSISKSILLPGAFSSSLRASRTLSAAPHTRSLDKRERSERAPISSLLLGGKNLARRRVTLATSKQSSMTPRFASLNHRVQQRANRRHRRGSSSGRRAAFLALLHHYSPQLQSSAHDGALFLCLLLVPRLLQSWDGGAPLAVGWVLEFTPWDGFTVVQSHGPGRIIDRRSIGRAPMLMQHQRRVPCILSPSCLLC